MRKNLKILTREDRFADYLSKGLDLQEVGRAMNLNKNQIARTWSNIKRGLGLYGTDY